MTLGNLDPFIEEVIKRDPMTGVILFRLARFIKTAGSTIKHSEINSRRITYMALNELRAIDIGLLGGRKPRPEEK